MWICLLSHTLQYPRGWVRPGHPDISAPPETVLQTPGSRVGEQICRLYRFLKFPILTISSCRMAYNPFCREIISSAFV